MKHHTRLAPMLVVSFLSSAAALAQSPAPAPAWGTSSFSSVVVSALDMQPTQSTTTWAMNVANVHKYLTSNGFFYAPLHTPQGARITMIELEACDASASGFVQAYLFRTTAEAPTQLAYVDTGLDAASGCSRWTSDLAVPETVDNDTYRYYVQAGNSPYNETETIGAVRVFYQLQVSPAPGAANFADVPTGHPFFQFIEALAGSGITAGCGGGNYCPDNPLTRGQMAVFLAKALGLHFPAEPTTN